MPYRPLDHTADVGVEIEAQGRDALFAEALVAFTDTLTEMARVAPRERRELAVEAPDLEQLLVEWLGELLFRFEVEGRLFARAEVTVAERPAGEGGGLALSAAAWGEAYDPERHPVKVLIKGVTFHHLVVGPVARLGGRWRARVIFDI